MDHVNNRTRTNLERRRPATMMANQWMADEVRPWLFADPEKAEA